MHKFLSALIFAPLLANASVVEVRYSGAIGSMFEATCLNMSTYSCAGYGIEYVSGSAFFQGQRISIGDTFGGSFRYSTDARLSGISQDGSQATYLDAVTDSQFTPQSFAMLPTSGLGALAIVDNRSGIDSFYAQQSFRQGAWFATFSMSLFDNAGNIFSDFSIPIGLDSNMFDTLYFSLGFINQQNNQLQVSGYLTKVSFTMLDQSIPEPSAPLLLLCGCAVMILTRRFT